MKVLLLGSGGREHALAWRLSRDSDVRSICASPGNPGIASIARCVPVDITDPVAVLALAEREGVDLTIVGPEGPLDRGLADAFADRGLPIVGPSRAGAALECSKAAAKAFMADAGVPTARFVVCDDATSALDVVSGRDFGFPVVVKADGLAAGKGVVVAEDRHTAQAAVRAAMVDRQFGSAGARLVIEEYLTGPEVSYFVLTDGDASVILGTAQDHKRLQDDDRGPNTGGMGAFAPSPLLTPELDATVRATIVQPTLNQLRARGIVYRGFLYVSLMLTPTGPQVIEYNVRLGDPEAQVLLPLVEGPFASALAATARGRLGMAAPLHLRPECTVGIVLASGGYPGTVETGVPINGLDKASGVPGATIFHAGTRLEAGAVVTAGGRVLTAVGRHSTYEGAMAIAYDAARRIDFRGMQYRRDIGRRAVVFAGGIRTPPHTVT